MYFVIQYEIDLNSESNNVLHFAVQRTLQVRT